MDLRLEVIIPNLENHQDEETRIAIEKLLVSTYPAVECYICDETEYDEPEPE